MPTRRAGSVSDDDWQWPLVQSTANKYLKILAMEGETSVGLGFHCTSFISSLSLRMTALLQPYQKAIVPMRLEEKVVDVPCDDVYVRFHENFACDRERIFAKIYALLPHQADAEDVFQRTSMLLWKKFSQYDGKEGFLPWACTVAHYEVLNFLRTAQRNRLQFDASVMALMSCSESMRFQRTVLRDWAIGFKLHWKTRLAQTWCCSSCRPLSTANDAMHSTSVPCIFLKASARSRLILMTSTWCHRNLSSFSPIGFIDSQRPRRVCTRCFRWIMLEAPFTPYALKF